MDDDTLDRLGRAEDTLARLAGLLEEVALRVDRLEVSLTGGVSDPARSDRDGRQAC